MPDRLSIPLVPRPVDIDGAEYVEIRGWPFADAFVARLLRDDIPRRVRFGGGRIWGYRDPGGQLVGFGTLDLCWEYDDLSGGRMHPYLPLLAVHPTFQGRGHGGMILGHLIDEASSMVVGPRSAWIACERILYLDVYTNSFAALALYDKHGFDALISAPIADPAEGGREFIIMGRQIGLVASRS